MNPSIRSNSLLAIVLCALGTTMSLAANAQVNPQVAEAMATMSQAVDETSQSAGQVQQASGEVTERSQKLRGMVDQFLTDVAAA